MSALPNMYPGQMQSLIAAKYSNQKPARPPQLSETLLRLGYLTSDQVSKIEKARRGKSFGRTAVRLRALTPERLEYALGVHLGFLHDSTDHVTIPRELIVARNPFCEEANQFRSLRTHLTTGGETTPIDRLSVTGIGDDHGACYTAVNLAASLVRLGKRVLLVDSNLRAPSLARIFGGPNIPGLSDIIIGKTSYESARRGTLIKNLDLLPAGSIVSDPQTILAEKSFYGMIKRATTEYEIVIMLTAPIGNDSQCEFVWRSSSSALLVGERDETRQRDVDSAKAVLRRTKTSVAGVVLTK